MSREDSEKGSVPSGNSIPEEIVGEKTKAYKDWCRLTKKNIPEDPKELKRQTLLWNDLMRARADLF